MFTSFPGPEDTCVTKANSLSIICIPISVSFVSILKGHIPLCSFHKASLKNLSCMTVSPSDQKQHRHTCTLNITDNSHWHTLRHTSTSQQVHANTRGHAHARTHPCTHSAWLSGSHSTPGSVCLKSLVYAFLQSSRDMTGWPILRDAPGPSSPSGRYSRLPRSPQNMGSGTEGEKDSLEAKQIWENDVLS